MFCNQNQPFETNPRLCFNIQSNTFKRAGIQNKATWFLGLSCLEIFGPCGTKKEEQEGNARCAVTYFDFQCNPSDGEGLKGLKKMVG